MGILWGVLKKKGWLFWATFCTLNVVLCIRCTPLLKTPQNIIKKKVRMILVRHLFSPAVNLFCAHSNSGNVQDT